MADARVQILHNHLGYEPQAPKVAILRADPNLGVDAFEVVDATTDELVWTGMVADRGLVDGWQGQYYYTLDFSDVSQTGRYYLRLRCDDQKTRKVHSACFRIDEDLIWSSVASDNVDYFKTQRCSGGFDRQDKSIPFVGERSERIDVHGGWYDASGDTSKYLSHLSYANFMNPQQTPLLPWNFLQAAQSLQDSTDLLEKNIRRRLIEEAVYGGDFLMRMQDPAGYFYMTVFDRWSKDLAQREICAYATQQGHKYDTYQSGYRQGAGIAIAALAKLSTLDIAGDFGPKDYLRAAERGFDHLESHNCEYLDDGQENIIDDYCALTAAVELYRATDNSRYLDAARSRAQSLQARQCSDNQCENYWRADASGARPYFHAAEAGFPVISLAHYVDVETDETRRNEALTTMTRAMRFELDITGRVNNPFGYPRQYVKAIDGEKSVQFFFPHKNESGYWWQGENARLGSLAAAARMTAARISDAKLQKQLQRYAWDCINWILGQNPFDMCMLHGHGHNNPEYEYGYPQSCGGICNGITSGYYDEHDIDFAPDSLAGQGDQIWRWGEQWIPHAAWFILAIHSDRISLGEKRAQRT